MKTNIFLLLLKNIIDIYFTKYNHGTCVNTLAESNIAADPIHVGDGREALVYELPTGDSYGSGIPVLQPIVQLSSDVGYVCRYDNHSIISRPHFRSGLSFCSLASVQVGMDGDGRFQTKSFDGFFNDYSPCGLQPEHSRMGCRSG